MAAFAGLYPFLVMADRARKFFWGNAVLLGARFGNQHVTAPFLRAQGENLAFVADEQMPVRALFFVLLQFFRTWRTQSSIVPDEFHWHHVSASGKLIGDHRGQGISLRVHPGGTGLHTGRMAKFQRAKHRIKRVTSDVTQRTRSEIPPAAPLERQVSRM